MHELILAQIWSWKALYRRYGRFFAEFLEDISPVRLSLLDLATCGGLRYGSAALELRSFSWERFLQSFLELPVRFPQRIELPLKAAPRIYQMRALSSRTQIQ